MKESSYNKLIAVLAVIGALLVVLFFASLFLVLCIEAIIPRILIWMGVKKRERPRTVSIVLEMGPEGAIKAKDDIKL